MYDSSYGTLDFLTSLNMHTVIFKISGMSKIWSARTYFWANVCVVILDDSNAIL